MGLATGQGWGHDLATLNSYGGGNRAYGWWGLEPGVRAGPADRGRDWD